MQTLGWEEHLFFAYIDLEKEEIRMQGPYFENKG
jgi:hypothetical protein